MTSWDTLGLHEPLDGSPEDYAIASAETTRVCEAVRHVAVEFARLKGDGSVDQMQGQAGNQLRVIVEAVDNSLQDLPGVLEGVSEIFDTHRTGLEALEQRASEALARGTVGWDRKETAQRQKGSAESALSWINGQINQILTYGTEEEQAFLPTYYSQEQTHYANIRVHDLEIELGDAEVTYATATHRAVIEEENVLRQTTVNSLNGVDLGDLDDPNAAMAFLGAVGGGIAGLAEFAYGIGESLVKAGIAALDGRLMDAIWHLSDALGDVLTVLAVVGLVVAIIASGGAIIALAAIAAGALKLGLDVALAINGSPHPETGEVMSWKSVAIDFTILLFNIATLGIGAGANGAFRAGGAAGASTRAAASSTAASVSRTAVANGTGGIRHALSAHARATINWAGDDAIRLAGQTNGVTNFLGNFRGAESGFAASNAFYNVSMTGMDVLAKGNPLTDWIVPEPFDGMIGSFADVVDHRPAASPVTTDLDRWDTDFLNVVYPPTPAGMEDIHRMEANILSPAVDPLSMEDDAPWYELVDVGDS